MGPLLGRSKKKEGKLCPFKMTIGIGPQAPISRLCEKQYCAIWVEGYEKDTGKCAFVFLANKYNNDLFKKREF